MIFIVLFVLASQASVELAEEEKDEGMDVEIVVGSEEENEVGAEDDTELVAEGCQTEERSVILR